MSDAARRLRDARRLLRAARTLMRTARLDAMPAATRDVLQFSPELDAEIAALEWRIEECETHCAALRRRRQRAA